MRARLGQRAGTLTPCGLVEPVGTAPAPAPCGDASRRLRGSHRSLPGVPTPGRDGRRHPERTTTPRRDLVNTRAPSSVSRPAVSQGRSTAQVRARRTRRCSRHRAGCRSAGSTTRTRALAHAESRRDEASVRTADSGSAARHRADATIRDPRHGRIVGGGAELRVELAFSRLSAAASRRAAAKACTV